MNLKNLLLPLETLACAAYDESLCNKHLYARCNSSILNVFTVCQ